MAITAGVVLWALVLPRSAVAVLPQQLGGVDLLSQANVRLDGAAVGDSASESASAGDVNGDGRADVIIGAGASNNGRSGSGSAYVVFGRAASGNVDLGELGMGGFRIDGGASFDMAGQSVATAGDVNADGLADVIVSAPFASNNGRPGSGSVYVVFGKPDSANVDLGALGTRGFRIDGAGSVSSGAGIGFSVAGAGDVNGDGRPDVIVGDLNASNNGRMSSGSAYVVFSTADNTNVDLSVLGTGGFRIDGAAPSDAAGRSVAGAGDINGDGKADVIVGAPGLDTIGMDSASVVFGKADSANVDLSVLDTGGFRIDGIAPGNDEGNVAAAGDVNGDGKPDVIVGAPTASNNSRANSGSAYVVFGKADSTKVDLNALGASGFRIDGASVGDLAGFVAAGGDVNGDGRPDVIVGAPTASYNGRAASGSAYVVFGKAVNTNVDLRALGTGGFRIDGASAGDESAHSVAGAGDFSGDGLPDVILGAGLADNNGRGNSGSAYVVYGFDADAPVPSPAAPPLPLPAPASGGPAGVVLEPGVSVPTNVTAPSIFGHALVGQLLTCAHGDWTGGPLFEFAWLRAGVMVSDRSDYWVVSDDVARNLVCRVTASNAAGSAVATSAPVKPTRAPPRLVTIRTKGGIRPLVGVSKRTCAGTMALTLRKGKQVLGRHAVRLSARCRWKWTFRVSRTKLGNARTLKLEQRFSGNAYVQPAMNTRTINVPRA